MFQYKYLCLGFNKSVFNWTFCQLLCLRKNQLHSLNDKDNSNNNSDKDGEDKLYNNNKYDDKCNTSYDNDDGKCPNNNNSNNNSIFSKFNGDKLYNNTDGDDKKSYDDDDDDDNWFNYDNNKKQHQ